MAAGTQMVLEAKKNKLNNSSKYFTFERKTKTVVSSCGLFNTYKNKDLHLKQTL